MNVSVIRYVLGYVLQIEAALFLVTGFVALIYQESDGFYYLFVAIACVLIGILASWHKPHDFVFYLKEGCVITALSWIVMSIFGALPLYLSNAIPSYTDALFETISGFTTTGASILDDVEALEHCHLFWRSLTHWIGGMGVLVFLLMIIPLSGGSNLNLMRAESPGPSVSKIKPKMKNTARTLYKIYFGLTVIEAILLLLGKMPLFDTICTTFGTAGTGGFGIKADSLGSYSPYIQWIVTIFMILFSFNFNIYYFLLLHQWKKAFCIEEIRWYLFIIFSAVLVIFINLIHISGNAGKVFRDSCFQVASIISSTGFSTTDFNQWPETSRMLLVILMFIGACAGSTGGGMKVSRIVILVKSLGKELSSFIHPKIVRKIYFEGKPVEHEVVRSTNVFLVTFFLTFTASIFVLSLENKDLISTFTAVTTTMNNIGPGLEAVGPAESFSGMSVLSKYVLMFDMLAGRLELFPLLILFHPILWKDTLTRQQSIRKFQKSRDKSQINS